MRARTAAATLLVLLTAAAPARAGDPIMPLGDVRAGMRCTGYSVIRGTDISAFDVEVIDVVDGDPARDGPRILVRASGAAVDGSGIATGFSGSPIYCPDGQGVSRNIGAISEGVGEYGGGVVLATPIEAILGVAVEGPAPRPPARPAGPAGRSRRAWAARVARSARPLAGPLYVSGVSARLGRLLAAAGRKAGRPVLATPAGPLGSFPPQTLRPGSSLSVGVSSGDLRVGGIGTVAYADGDRIWGLGHEFDGVGRRSLLLQDAYVFRVINNPLELPEVSGSYKLAAPGHDLGTISNDELAAVAGRLGVLPRTIPVRVYATDEDRDRTRTLDVEVADETLADSPTGSSGVALLGPTAVAQAATSVLGGSPARLTGTMCARIVIAELRRPLRLCNRYVSATADTEGVGNVVAARAATDLLDALDLIDDYRAGRLQLREVSARLKLRRGQRQAFLRSVRLPARVRPGQRVRVRVSLRVVRGPRLVRSYRMRMPSGLAGGARRLVFSGVDVDSPDGALGDGFTITLGDEELDGGDGDLGPDSPRALAEAVRALQRYDGVRMRGGDVGRVRAFRDPELRISGRATAETRVVRR